MTEAKISRSFSDTANNIIQISVRCRADFKLLKIVWERTLD